LTGDLFCGVAIPETDWPAMALIKCNSLLAEYLNTADLPHYVPVKVGAPVILLRNPNRPDRLCNGTRMRMLTCGERVLDEAILSGKHSED